MDNNEINIELSNLHEEILFFLLKYRDFSKYIEKPNFLFRPTTDIDALNQGRWFYDNHKTGWVNIYFTNSNGERYDSNNVQFGVNTNGKWNIGVYVLRLFNNKFEERFFENLIQSFSNVVHRRHKQDEIRYNGNSISLIPIDKNYRTGLPEAIDVLFQFLKQEQRYFEVEYKRKMPLSFVSEAYFHESLYKINEYRKQQKIKSVYIKGFHIKNYQGIRDTQIDDLPSKPSWIFLTGENGLGKTLLLKVLSMGLYGDEEDIITPREKESDIQVNYCYVYGTDRKLKVDNSTRQPLFFRTLQTLAAYGPSRLEIQANDSQKQQVRKSTATYNLFHTDGILKNIESELLISYYDSPEKFEKLCNMLIALIPSLGKIELDKKRRKILYYEKAETYNGQQTTTFEPIEYEHLASGIRSLVATAGDIYLRLSDAQQKLDNSILEIMNMEKTLSDESIYSPNELFGIVIIDEFDLHLHPKWQREIPALLSKVFPNVQFIVSTHSPIPLLGSPPDSVFLKIDRTIEKGINVKRLILLEKNISNLLPNSILTSPIFDFEQFFPVTHDRNEPIETADYYKTILEKNVLEKELNILGDSFKFPEDLKKKGDEKGI